MSATYEGIVWVGCSGILRNGVPAQRIFRLALPDDAAAQGVFAASGPAAEVAWLAMAAVMECGCSSTGGQVVGHYELREVDPAGVGAAYRSVDETERVLRVCDGSPVLPGPPPNAFVPPSGSPPTKAGRTDLEARAILLSQLSIIGEQLEPQSLDLAQALARAETGYGDWWKDEMAGSNNWGAQHAKGPPCVPPARPGNDEGAVCFQSWATPEDGARALLSLLLSRRLAGPYLRSGAADPDGFAEALKRDGYYRAPLGRYQAMLRGALRSVQIGTGRTPAPRNGVAGALALAGLVGIGIGAYALRP